MSRNPLQARDQNANIMIRAPQKGAPLSTRSGNNATATMPYDKQSNARPLAPTLSAAAAKNTNKTPLTPRVAGASPALATTPLARRTARHEGGGTPNSQAQDFSTPVSSFLATNVTPRSAKRNSRVESPVNTPTGTPAPEPLRAADGYNNGGLGISGFDASSRRPTAPYSPAASDIGGQRDQAPSNADAKFFFASDAKTAAQPPRPQPRPPLQSKASASTFFYANGDSIPPPISSGASAVGSSIGEERSQPKFFHANGTPDLKPSPANFFPPPGSSVSTNSHSPSPRLAASASVVSLQQRPTSPVKASPNVSFSSLKNTPSLSSPVLARPAPLGRGNSVPDTHARRVSIELPPRPVSRDKSVVGVQQTPSNTSARRISIGSPLALPSPVSPLMGIETVASPIDLSAASDDATDPTTDSAMSPTKAGGSLEHMNELAANARRERKVLDLEITNSSLAAINRTLEREMRKQAAELRRFRRLSRSGRLSIITSGSRTSTGTLTTIGEDGQPLSDMSEDEEDSEDESDSSSGSDEYDEGSLSPSAMAENDARHRKKDEKRLQLDLSKHQQLLVDSQKMNQSLKRCLGWTEALIAEGKKALAYNVRVSDVELGGRVLAPEEERYYDEGEDSVARILETGDTVEGFHNTWGTLGKEDRDSGIEVDPANTTAGSSRSLSELST